MLVLKIIPRKKSKAISRNKFLTKLLSMIKKLKKTEKLIISKKTNKWYGTWIEAIWKITLFTVSILNINSNEKMITP